MGLYEVVIFSHDGHVNIFYPCIQPCAKSLAQKPIGDVNHYIWLKNEKRRSRSLCLSMGTKKRVFLENVVGCQAVQPFSFRLRRIRLDELLNNYNKLWRKRMGIEPTR